MHKQHFHLPGMCCAVIFLKQRLVVHLQSTLFRFMRMSSFGATNDLVGYFCTSTAAIKLRVQTTFSGSVWPVMCCTFIILKQQPMVQMHLALSRFKLCHGSSCTDNIRKLCLAWHELHIHSTKATTCGQSASGTLQSLGIDVQLWS